ncbi:MAG: tRNA 2-selenouridine(34) synthase MnmH [Bacteroidota bacterium]
MALSLDDFLKLRAQLPVVDVRSPLEFTQGHIRGAINIPLLNNEERAQVGTDYKQKGQKEAIKTGFRLVGPRLIHIIEETDRVGRELLVHCWRGGMRSNNFSLFVGMAGIKTHTLVGGYKAYRQRAAQMFQHPFRFWVLGGSTGSGKSEVLRALKTQGAQVIDLEALASHKGSAFGGLTLPPQPTTEQFQNELLEEILQLDLSKPVFIEDESIAIGKIFLPPDFWRTLCQSPVLELDVEKSVRVRRLAAEYGIADKHAFLEAMGNIVKRLGGQHYLTAKDRLLAGDMEGTIDILLTYYDKAYARSLEKKKERIKFRFSWDGTDPHTFAEHLRAELNE